MTALKEIIFLIQTPLNYRDLKRFGVDRLRARGLRVGFLDVTDIVNPEYPKNEVVEQQYHEGLANFSSSRDFDEYISGKDPSKLLVIDMIGCCNVSTFIYRIFNKYKIKYASFCANSIPLPSENRGINRFSMAFLMNKLLAFAKQARLSLWPKYAPAFILAGGKKYGRKYPMPDESTKIIWAHTLDYDLYLDFIDAKPDPLVNHEYAVFLDEYFPFHPDFKVSGMISNPYPDPEGYFGEMNQIFDQLEKHLGVPIVIAAHPRSNYDNMNEKFNKRRRFRGKTIELVADAKYVLAHSSTSLNFAVIFRKPTIFVTPEKVRNGYYGRLIEAFSLALGKKPHNINSIKSIGREKELHIDEGTYCRYMNDYIKKEMSPRRHFWDIVVDEARDAERN